MSGGPSISCLDSDGFQLVTRKKGRRRGLGKGVATVLERKRTAYSGPPCEELYRRLQSCWTDMEESQFFKEFLGLSEAALGGCTAFSEVVCYGIGCIGESPPARHQMAFLTALRHHWKPDCVWIFDPMLADEECSVIRQLGFQLLPENEAGKHPATVPTMFFMPHCGRALYNNLLWANWSEERLAQTAIIGNSFSKHLERLPSKQLEKEAPFIYHILPHVTEHPLPWQTYSDPSSFTDTSLHTFTPHTLPSSLWDLRKEEPNLDPTDPEIII